MKKKLFLAGATLLLAAAVTGFAAYERSNMSDLMDANVEALARNEGDAFNCASGCGGDLLLLLIKAIRRILFRILLIVMISKIKACIKFTHL